MPLSQELESLPDTSLLIDSHDELVLKTALQEPQTPAQPRPVGHFTALTVPATACAAALPLRTRLQAQVLRGRTAIKPTPLNFVPCAPVHLVAAAGNPDDSEHPHLPCKAKSEDTPTRPSSQAAPVAVLRRSCSVLWDAGAAAGTSGPMIAANAAGAAAAAATVVEMPTDSPKAPTTIKEEALALFKTAGGAPLVFVELPSALSGVRAAPAEGIDGMFLHRGNQANVGGCGRCSQRRQVQRQRSRKANTREQKQEQQQQQQQQGQQQHAQVPQQAPEGEPSEPSITVVGHLSAMLQENADGCPAPGARVQRRQQQAGHQGPSQNQLLQPSTAGRDAEEYNCECNLQSLSKRLRPPPLTLPAAPAAPAAPATPATPVTRQSPSPRKRLRFQTGWSYGRPPPMEGLTRQLEELQRWRWRRLVSSECRSSQPMRQDPVVQIGCDREMVIEEPSMLLCELESQRQQQQQQTKKRKKLEAGMTEPGLGRRQLPRRACRAGLGALEEAEALGAAAAEAPAVEARAPDAATAQEVLPKEDGARNRRRQLAGAGAAVTAASGTATAAIHGMPLTEPPDAPATVQAMAATGAAAAETAAPSMVRASSRRRRKASGGACRRGNEVEVPRSDLSGSAAAEAGGQEQVVADPRVSTWVPPASPWGLIEEALYDDPWRLLVACILLNRTTGRQVRQVLGSLWRAFPTAEAMAAADPRVIQGIVRPLGLHVTRASKLVRFSCEYLWKQWTCPTQLHGVGRYGADAYLIFCRGRWREVQPDDKDLRRYLDWLHSTGGEGSGLEREDLAAVLQGPRLDERVEEEEEEEQEENNKKKKKKKKKRRHQTPHTRIGDTDEGDVGEDGGGQSSPPEAQLISGLRGRRRPGGGGGGGGRGDGGDARRRQREGSTGKV